MDILTLDGPSRLFYASGGGRKAPRRCPWGGSPAKRSQWRADAFARQNRGSMTGGPSMCNHRYVGNYERASHAIGQRCPYPELYARRALTLPLDERGTCIFHSG